ncbi:MAG TPA: response regulator transcription factor [Nitrospira sp.]|nr:response regulator transcription factor [Nitrospira sp.]
MRQALVVDEHPIVRKGVKDLLKEAFPSLTIRDSSGNTDLLEGVRAYPWAFVILEINMPGLNGLDLIKQVTLRHPSVPIIVFSLYPEKQYASRALRAGATAYLSKDCQPKDLVRTVRSALKASPPKKRPEQRTIRPDLSNRELQVLNLLVKGMNRKEISKTLGIKERTVSTYRFRLFSKLEVRNTIELVRYAIEERLLQ